MNALLLQEALQHLLGLWISMDEHDVGKVSTRLHFAGKLDQIALVGMGGKAVEYLNFCMQRVFDAEDLQLRPAFYQPAPQGVRRLITDDQYGVLGIADGPPSGGAECVRLHTCRWR